MFRCRHDRQARALPSLRPVCRPAWRTAFELAEPKPGQTVLVSGTGNADGSPVAQLAVDAAERT